MSACIYITHAPTYTDIIIEIQSINVAAGYISAFIFLFYVLTRKDDNDLAVVCLFVFPSVEQQIHLKLNGKNTHEFPCIAEKLSKKIGERCIAATHRINRQHFI